MPTIDIETARVEYDRLGSILEERESCWDGTYDPDLDDLQWEVAALRRQLRRS